MKNAFVLLSITFLCAVMGSCKKNGAPGKTAPLTFLTFSAGDSLINYPVTQAAIQDVYTTHTTLITGEYADSPVQKGSLSIRLVGDTTGRFRGDSLFVTYTDASGKVYTGTNDVTSYVVVDKYIKTYNGVVSGSFDVKVFAGSDSIDISKGTFSALYQE